MSDFDSSYNDSVIDDSFGNSYNKSTVVDSFNESTNIGHSKSTSSHTSNNVSSEHDCATASSSKNSNNFDISEDEDDDIRKTPTEKNTTSYDFSEDDEEDFRAIATGKTTKNLIVSDSEDDDEVIKARSKKSFRIVPAFSSDDDGEIGEEETHHTDEDNDNEVIEPTSAKITPRRSNNFIKTEKNSDNGNEIATSKLNESDVDDALQLIEKSISIVEISSDEENRTFHQANTSLKQPTIKSFFSKIEEKAAPQVNCIKQENYFDQKKKVADLEAELFKIRNTMRIINTNNLPDKGKLLHDKEESLMVNLEKEKNILATMNPPSVQPPLAQNKIQISWDEIQAGVENVEPRTFGKIGVARFKAERHMAMETLDELHKSLDTCPTENDLAEDPKGLKVSLMHHQKRALTWLMWREKQKPSGGILADDMGLGKTLTMISLIIKTKELEESSYKDKENYRDKYPGGTLVVCPASLLNQWAGEIESKTKRGLLAVEVHHGTKRETKPKKLAQHDVVVTTYALILSADERNGPVFGVRWRRIILDEAHQIRNYKSRTSEAVFRLSAKSRWSLTGTPVHNKELDIYAQLKFLRCAPFDNLQVWKHWVSDKSTGGQMRLHAVISSIMLRRTKDELMAKGMLQSLPSRKWELIAIKLEKNEMDVYQKVMIFSRTLFAQFLHQRAEKRQDEINFKFSGPSVDPNGEYFKMRNRLLKLNKVKEVSQHEILVLLLRLRQICCHPSLITEMLHGDEDLGDAEDEEDREELNLLEQLNKLDINDDEPHALNIEDQPVGLKEASKGYLNPSNPVFAKNRRSSKIAAVIKLLKEKVYDDDKAIIVSQWTSLLHLVAIHLSEENIGYDHLNGSIPVHKRMPIIDSFNDPKSDTQVLLLSLTAGGVGLNLIGANHLFLLDLHWNPQLENQAQDRIYRMGQEKPVFIYKFMAEGTIEERIKMLQDNKLEIADSMLTGSKKVTNSKLTLQDLKMLFELN